MSKHHNVVTTDHAASQRPYDVRRLPRVILVVLGITLSPGAAAAPPLDAAVLETWLEEIRGQHNLIGAGATVEVGGTIVASAAVGKRKQNTKALVTTDDKWHLGSISKSMTATVVGRLVERNQLAWDTPLPLLLPDMATHFHTDWQAVTLQHILTHTAGLPANFALLTQFKRSLDPQTLHDTRRSVVAAVLALPPKSAAGEKFLYSNVGYTLAGLVAAERCDTWWETLIHSELFEPLQLTTAGLGPPEGEQALSEPWGHQRLLFMRIPHGPNEFGDNTPVMAPAGGVHMSMADAARFGRAHLEGMARDTPLLRRDSWRHLHKSQANNYACGWVTQEYDWSDGAVLWHNGSNTMWYALLMLVPSRDAVIVIVTNDGYLPQAGTAFETLAQRITQTLPTVSTN